MRFQDHLMSAVVCRFMLSFGLTATLLVGCAGSRNARLGDTEKSGITNFELMREDFDPKTLGEAEIPIQESVETNSDIDVILSDQNEAIEDSVITGYRVQLIQTTDPEEVRNVQKDAILQFDHEVYRVFDPPFYKVRVGDFAEWRDAENLQQEAIKRGYREAWVIRTKVNLMRSVKGVDEM
ncbi:SPOR domain-containing protein [bacterium]|nr:SPOR domain-containing protein [bacterium]